MDKTGADPRVQAGACAYLLVGILQRLEKHHPGLITDAIAGVEADRLAIPGGVRDKEFIEKIFAETLRLLHLANQVPRS